MHKSLYKTQPVLINVLFAGDDGNTGGDTECNSVRLQDLHAQQQSGETIPEEEVEGEGGEGGSSSDERDRDTSPPPMLSTPPATLAEQTWREVTVLGGD